MPGVGVVSGYICAPGKALSTAGDIEKVPRLFIDPEARIVRQHFELVVCLIAPAAPFLEGEVSSTWLTTFPNPTVHRSVLPCVGPPSSGPVVENGNRAMP